MRGILGGISSRVGPPTSTPFRMLLTASLRSDRLQFSSRRVPSGFRVDFSFFVFRLFQEKWKPRGLLRARWRPRIVCFEKKNGRPTRPTRGGRFESNSFFCCSQDVAAVCVSTKGLVVTGVSLKGRAIGPSGKRLT